MDALQRLASESWAAGMLSGAFLALMYLFLFQLKHLFIDFFIQNRAPYLWMNKHKFFHPAGWLHAGSHAVGSFMILGGLGPPVVGGGPWLQAVLILCGAELIIHFLIDLVKMRICIWRKWKCNTSPKFWDLLGIDQFLHQVTYLVMVAIWVGFWVG